MNRLFREENIEKSCLTCENMRKDETTGDMTCIKRKNITVAETDVCRKYRYNIFSKQVMRKKALDNSRFDKSDFSLD